MESLSYIKIILDDDDVFFRFGLKIIISNFFYKRKKEVLFVRNGASDIVIRTVDKSKERLNGREILILITQSKAVEGISSCQCKYIFSKYDMPEDFVFLLEKAMAGKKYSEPCFFCRRSLTPREKEILNGFSNGLSSKEIAYSFGLHIKSVSQHKRNAMRKLSLKNTRELALWLSSRNDGF